MLNKEQKAAVEHVDGPLLIIAGAGTGKTRVITSRILWLIEQKLARSSEILALTFTEKAASEMVERVDVAMPLGYEEVWIKTFHGFCEKVLRESGHEIGLNRDYRLLSKLQQWLFVKKHIFEFDLPYFAPLADPSRFISDLLNHFGKIKEEYISPDEYVAYASAKLKEAMEKVKVSNQIKIDKKSLLGIEIENVRKVLEAANAYKKYQELMLKENALDFGDLSYYTLRLFDERPSVLAKYQERFKYLMVDEFQDTNYAQFKLLMMLSSSHKNVCVVGDDDQSIFRWRGASLSNILQFGKVFPDAKKIVLTENYRSAQNILDASHHFVKFNDPDRLEARENIPKDLESKVDIKNQPIEIVHFESHVDETQFVVEKIKELAKKTSYKDIAILIRANAHAVPFTDELKKAAIPFYIKNSEGLMSLPEIKDIIALCKVLSDRTDDVAMMRLLRMEIFDIQMDDILSLLDKAKTDGVHLRDVLARFKEDDVLPGMESSITKFAKFIFDLTEFSKKKSAGEVINRFLVSSGYLASLTDNFSLETHQKVENITSFSKIVWQFEKESSSPYITDLSEFLKLVETSHISIESEENVAKDEDAVQILTIHSAKGLEFDNVFIVNLVQHRFPASERSDALSVPLELTKEIFPDGDFSIQEERRLFYVALTRAKRKLFLTYSDKYSGNKKWKKSQFLDEIAESKLTTDVKGASSQPFSPLPEAPFKRVITAPKNWSGKNTFSFSQIDNFKLCPLKYGYRYALNVPVPPSHVANFGTSVHEALKDFYRVLMQNPAMDQSTTRSGALSETSTSAGSVAASSGATLDLLLHFYEQSWIRYGYENTNHEMKRKEQGREILKNFYNANSPFVVPAFIEKNFNLKIGQYMVNGRIDRIDKLPDGTYEVIDYKTGSGKNVNKDKKLQLQLYALACRDVFSIPASKLSFYFLEDGEKFSIPGGYEELDSVGLDIMDYIKKIKEGDFVPTPGFHCSFCDYRLICPEG